jgi:outer membrane immunogenic protein
MKNKFPFCAIVAGLLIIIGLGANNAAAQTLFGGAVFGTDTDLGIKLGGYFPVAEQIDAGGDFIYFFPSGFDMYEININGRYAIPVESDLGLYGIAGLNYSKLSFDESDLCGGSDLCKGSSSDVGLNIGGMASFGSGPVGFYADIKFILGGGEQLEIGGGVTFDI